MENGGRKARRWRTAPIPSRRLSAGVSTRVGRVRRGLLPAAVGVPAADGRRVTFAFRRDGASSVAVAGDFSGWQARPLTRGSNGTWTLDTVIAPGVYHYSFLVEGVEWVVPAGAVGVVDDGFGQKNATLIVDGSNAR